MRDAVMFLLAEWEKTLAAQAADDAVLLDDHLETDHYLDRHLHGVAMFLKTVAYKEGDVELLGICTKLEMDLKERFDAEARSNDEYEREGDRMFAALGVVKTACIRYFYKEPSFAVDLSKYREMIDRFAHRIENAAELAKLRRYVDDKRRLDDLYAATKHSVSPRGTEDDPQPPTFEDIKAAFEQKLADLLRRADNHVPAQLDKLVGDRLSAS